MEENPYYAQIMEAGHNPAVLEDIYRKTNQDDRRLFIEAIAKCSEAQPDNLLFQAWALRLDILPSEEVESYKKTSPQATPQQTRQWEIAIALSIILGLLFVIFTRLIAPVDGGGKNTGFLIVGWSPLTTLAILIYLAILQSEKRSWYKWPAALIIFLGLLSIATVWNRSDDIMNLTAVHLPFVTWAVLGWGLIGHDRDFFKQFYAYIVKSVEILIVSGIFALAGQIFVGLTFGILMVLGVSLIETEAFPYITIWGFGAIPLLAISSVYNPLLPLAEQESGAGILRILKVLSRLLLPFALIVLLVYVIGLIPFNFWQAFKEREALIVYNATIMAIILLVIFAAPGLKEKLSDKQSFYLRNGILLTIVLTVLLNIYALAAVTSRTIEGGLTPHRHAVLGWNVVTLAILIYVLAQAFIKKGDWKPAIQQSFGQIVIPAVAWSIWVLYGTQLFS